MASKPRARARSQQAVELEVPVALDAGVGRASLGVGGDVGVHDVAVEVGAEVEDVVVEPEVVGHPAGVLDVGHRAATLVGLAAPEAQGDARGPRGPARPGARPSPTSRPRRTWRSTSRRRTLDRGDAGGGCGAPRRRARPRGPGPRRPRCWPSPSERRSDPTASSRGTPMAASTWDGSTAPLAQDDAAEAATPASSSRKSRASLSTPGEAQVGSPAARPARSPRDAGLHRVGDGGQQPVGQAVAKRRDPGRGPRSPVGGQAAAAAAMATMPATFWVPLRRSRSWPPPIWRAASGTPRTDDEGTDALGAAELVGADRDQVGPGGGLGHVDPGQGLDGVGVDDGVGGVATDDLGHLGDGLDGADLVVDQHDRHEGDVVGASRSVGQGVEVDHAPRRRPATTRPPQAGGRVPHGGVLHGRAHHGAAPGRRGPRARPGCRPRCPPPVNTTSPGRRPAPSASTSRASSRTRRASRAATWAPDGLPGSSVSTRVISATASGRTGIEAA